MLNGLFSGSPGDLSRWNPWGLGLMALGVALALLADKLAGGRFGKSAALRLGGLAVVILGALVTMKILF